MKTQYFINTTAGTNALKRLKNGVINHFTPMAPDETKNVWVSSTLDVQDLQNTATFRKVSRDEARKLHPAAFRSVKKQPEVVKPGVALADTYRKALEYLDYKRSQKIAAIKAVRTIGFFGLAEALTIVEHFDKFLAFVEEHNLLPRVGGRFDDQPFSKA